MSKQTDFNKQLESSVGLVEKLTEEFVGLGKAANKVIKETTKAMSQSNKATRNSGSEMDKLNQKQKEASTASSKLLAVRRQQISTLNQINTQQARLSTIRDKQSQQLAQLRENTQRANRVQREEIRINSAQEGSIARLNAANARLRRERDQVNIATREGRERVQRLNNTIDQNTNIIRRNTDQVSRNSTQIGGYARGVLNATRQVAGMAGVFLGAQGLISAFKNSISIISKFETTMSRVKALTGANRKEFIELKENAKSLGATTQFTASQVGDLSVELGKLGFSTKEIIGASDAILGLAVAADTDLANAATITASTIKAFGKTAKDAANVADIMADSFSSTALDIGKFSVAMGAVAPVAKNANVSMERTTATLGILTDRGIDASTAGTGLRNIYLDLADKGLSWNSAMEKINTSTNKNATALDLFGKRGATVATIIANNIDGIDELTNQFENSTGAADRMSKIMEQNLTGETKKLQSAYEGLILAVDDGNGVFSTGLKSVVRGLTDVLGAITPVTNAILEEQTAVNILVAELTDANTEEGRRKVLLNELKEISPDIVEGLDAESLSMETLVGNLSRYNEQAIIRIALEQKQAELTEIQDKAAKKTNKSFEKKVDVLDLLTQLEKSYQNSLDISIKKEDERRATSLKEDLKIIRDVKSEFLAGSRDTIFLLGKYGEVGGKIITAVNAMDRLGKSAEKTGSEADKLKEEIEAFKKEFEDILDLDFDKKVIEDVDDAAGGATDEVDELTKAIKRLKAELSERLSAVDILEAADIEELRKSLDVGLISAKEYEEELVDIKNNFAQQRIEIELSILEAQKKVGDETVELEAEIAKKRLQLSDISTQKLLDNEKKLKEESAKELEDIGDTAKDVFNRVKAAAGNFGVTIFDREKEKKKYDQFIKDINSLEQQGLITSEDAQKARTDAFITNLQKGVDKFASKTGEVTGKIGDIVAANQQRQFAELELESSKVFEEIEVRRENELAAAGDDAEKKKEINAKFDKEKAVQQEKFTDKEKAIKKKSADVEFAITVAEIIANTARAIAKSLPNPVLAALSLGVGQAQLGNAIAQRQKIKSLAVGGVIDGPSHKNGGIPITVNGEYTHEMEGGEFVNSGKSTKNSLYSLNAINDGRWSDSDIVPAMEMYKSLDIHGGRTVTNNNADPVSISLLRSINKKLSTNKSWYSHNGVLYVTAQDGQAKEVWGK